MGGRGAYYNGMQPLIKHLCGYCYCCEQENTWSSRHLVSLQWAFVLLLS